MTRQDWLAIMPTLILAGTVLGLMLLDTILTKARAIFPLVTCVGAVGALMAAVSDAQLSYGFSGFMAHDGVSCGFTVVICLALALVSLFADIDLDAHEVYHRGEFYGLLSSAALGMVMMVSGNSLIMTFLGLELFSLALYLLCVFFPRENLCQEAGLKYFILSSLASAVMLYGMALLYGACGSTFFSQVTRIPQDPSLSVLSFVGLTLVLCGLGFKLSAVPFHMWTPDVYQGAPTSVAAFMSVATKAAALGTLWRFTPAFLPAPQPQMIGQFELMDPAVFFVVGPKLLLVLSVLSIVAGNLLALPQTSMKRMLAYSSIAQAGYLLIGIVSGTSRSGSAILFYLLVYCLMNIGAFAILTFIESGLRRPVSLDDLNGLGRSEPGLAAVLTLCLLSLAGLPPAGGLLAKLYLFGASFQGAFPAIVMAIIGSLIGAYYYLNPIGRMYMRDGLDLRLPGLPWAFTLVLVIVVLGLLTTGLFPTPILDWTSQVGQAAYNHLR